MIVIRYVGNILDIKESLGLSQYDRYGIFLFFYFFVEIILLFLKIT